MKFRSMAMNTHIGVAVLFLLGRRILCDAVTITSEGSLDGQWTFKEGSAVTLNCTINSYGNGMTWKFDSTVVAQCTPQICVPIRSGEGAFTFGFDIVNTGKKFYWTINPVKMAHHGKVFECSNGTAVSSFTATVHAGDGSPVDTIGIVALSFAIIGILVAVLISPIYICCMHCDCCDSDCKKKILTDKATVKRFVKKEDLQDLFIEMRLIEHLVNKYIQTTPPELLKRKTQVITDGEVKQLISGILSSDRKAATMSYFRRRTEEHNNEESVTVGVDTD